jgi:phosphotransferase system HPr-like phosphotransfer protein
MKISFRNIVQVDKFCKAAEKYDGNVTVSEGSISVDGESIVGIMTLGLNKILEVNISDKFSASAVQFESEIAKLGIERS